MCAFDVLIQGEKIDLRSQHTRVTQREVVLEQVELIVRELLALTCCVVCVWWSNLNIEISSLDYFEILWNVSFKQASAKSFRLNLGCWLSFFILFSTLHHLNSWICKHSLNISKANIHKMFRELFLLSSHGETETVCAEHSAREQLCLHLTGKWFRLFHSCLTFSFLLSTFPLRLLLGSKVEMLLTNN